MSGSTNPLDSKPSAQATSRRDAVFFVAGGTVPPGSPSYVERAADRELYEALLAGEYCYVLNSRQMGKSSLAVRTVEKLQAAGVKTAFVDLTRIGGANVNAEQWYAGLLAETGRALGLRAQASAFLKEHVEMGAAQRFLSFLQDVALVAAGGPLVMMIDEIDAIRSLPFSTDELFSGIRQLHNGRASHAELRELTFCLLGAALPSDLIRDPRTTPFNVGRRIELKDFTPVEAAAFAAGLSHPNADRMVQEVVLWTGGHPFLTQILCSALAGTPEISVKDLAKERYLDARAKETDTNLADIGNRLMGRGDPEVTDLTRADTLSLYSELLRRGISDDESNPNCARIKMSGVARLESGRLSIRNRIYERVFGPAWVRDNMPGQELRRQRRAYFTGVLRTGAVAIAVLSVIGTLALVAVRNAARANAAELGARHGAYAATMRNMIQWQDQHDLFLIDRATKQMSSEPWKGWEWKYWARAANSAKRVIPIGRYFNSYILVSPDGSSALTYSEQGLSVVDLSSGKERWSLKMPIFFFSVCATWTRDSKRIVVYPEAGEVRVIDSATGKLVKSRSHIPGLLLASTLGNSLMLGDRYQLVNTSGFKPALFDLQSLTLKPFVLPGDRLVSDGPVVTQDGAFALLPCGLTHNRNPDLAIWNLREGRISTLIPMGEHIMLAVPSPDSRFCALGSALGRISLVDIAKGKVTDQIKLPTSEIWSISFSSDGKLLAVTTDKRESILFDVLNGKLKERRRYLECLQAYFLPGSHELLTAYWDMREYNSDDPPAVPSARIPFGGPYSVAISSDGVLSASSGVGGSDIRLGSPSLQQQSSPEQALRQFDSQGKFAVVNLIDHSEIIDARTRRSILRWPYRVTNMNSFGASPDGRFLTLATDLKTLNLVDLNSGSTSKVIVSTSRAKVSRFSPDSKSVAVATLDGSISVFNVPDGSLRWVYRPGGLVFDDLAFSADGKRLAAGNDGDSADIFNSSSGAHIAHLLGHVSSVGSVAWSQDGSRLATGSADGTVHIWDPSTGDDFGIIGRHDGGVTGIGFLPGGRTLASFSSDGVVKLWMTEARR